MGREYPQAAKHRASPPARTQCGRKAHTPHAKGVLARTQRSLPCAECAFRCGARASPLQTARRMRHGIIGRGGCRSPIRVSRRGRVHFMWNIVRSAHLTLCGEGATVERSHGTRALSESASARLGRESLCVGNDWSAAARTSGIRTAATPSTHRGYSGYSHGVLWVLTGVLRVLTGLSTHRGVSAAARPSGTRHAEPKPR